MFGLKNIRRENELLRRRIKSLDERIEILEWNSSFPLKYKIGDIEKEYGTCFAISYIPRSEYKPSKGFYGGMELTRVIKREYRFKDSTTITIITD